MQRWWMHVALVTAVTGVVFFTNLGGAKLWDRDEPRNARCAAEMIERADWVTPYFNGALRTHKPVLTYWLMMSAYAVFGISEFSARFWSAALGVGTTLATYVIARRLFNPQAALWAALALAGSVMFCVASRAATPDAPLIFCSTMAIMVFVVGTFRPRADGDDAREPPQTWLPGRYFPASWPVVALMYGFMGLGVLAKGPVGIVLPTAVIGMFLLLMRLPATDKQAVQSTDRRPWSILHWGALASLVIGLVIIDRSIGPWKTFACLAAAVVGYGIWKPDSLCRRLIAPFHPRHFLITCWHMRPLTALAIALAIALPWYVWVGVRTDGEWLTGFFVQHNVARATQTFEGHNGSFLFYPLSTLGGMFPWSILLVPAAITAIRQIRGRDPWMISYLFVACWAGVYMGLFSLAATKLPSYITPAYPALAMVMGAFVFQWARGPAAFGRRWPYVAFGVLAAVGVGMAVGMPIAASTFLPGEAWLSFIGLIPLVAGAVAIILHTRKHPAWAAGTLAVCSVLLLTTAFAVVGPRVSAHQHIVTLLDEVQQRSPSAKVAGHRAHEPSWVFYFGRTIPYLRGDESDRVAEFLRDPDAFVVTTDRALAELPPLPPGVQPIARERCFLKKYDLVVLGRTAEGVREAHRQAGQPQRH